MVQTKRADFNGLAKELGVSPVSVRIMRNRGMETKEAMERYLYGTLDGLYDGALMKNMGEAVAVLIKKLREEKRIRIIGDYDIDGVCASYLLNQFSQSQVPGAGHLLQPVFYQDPVFIL